jgi:CheY-like chemotaxis protein
LAVEDGAELRSLTAALFEDEQTDTIECESAEAAVAILLIGGREVAMIFAEVDLAREVKMRWPLLPVILTSGHPRDRVDELSSGVAYMPKPWQPLNVLIATEQTLASRVSCAASAGQRERSGGLRTCRRPWLLFRIWFAGERGRRCRQHFPFGRKPVLLGLAVHTAMCGPDLIGAFANAVFQALVHVRHPSGLMMERS